jgi:hypothetical protein
MISQVIGSGVVEVERRGTAFHSTTGFFVLKIVPPFHRSTTNILDTLFFYFFFEN